MSFEPDPSNVNSKPPVNKKITSREVLWSAIRENDLDGVVKALENGADPNSGYSNWIPLGKSIRDGTPEIAMALIKAGADIFAKDQDRSTAHLAISKAAYNEVTKEMIARGVKPSIRLLRSAVMAENTQMVKHLLDMGVDPTEASTNQDERSPTLTLWPYKNSRPPQELIHAFYSRPLNDTTVANLAIAISRVKDIDRLKEMMAYGKMSEGAKNTVLKHAITSCWQEGTCWILDNKYCDPKKEQLKNDSVIIAMSSWLGSKRQSKSGWEVLQRLIDYGYNFNSIFYSFYSSRNEEETAIPVGFAAIARVDKNIQKKFLTFMKNNGLNPLFDDDRYPDQKNTLAHHFMSMNRGGFELLPELIKLWPDIEWDSTARIPLACIWAENHQSKPFTDTTGRDIPFPHPLKSLQKVLSMPGVDILKPGKNESSVARYVLVRNHPNNRALYSSQMHTPQMLDEIIRELLSLGVDMKKPDIKGIDDFTWISEHLYLPEGMKEKWLEISMERDTLSRTPQKKKSMRL